tara:strand:+ start:1617 stop:2996 length:1380 start_codon:yes stop_codon:yes gene_type:complete
VKKIATKLVIFDLDGVLVESKETHYVALNKALKNINSKFMITKSEQEISYEALSTMQKLKKLTKEKKLPEKLYNKIWQDKQNLTFNYLSKIKKDQNLIKFFKKIKNKNINIAVASNSIRETCELVIKLLGLTKYVDLITSNEDVISPKPHPEMYWKSMIHFKVEPDQTIIIEDSEIGKRAAKKSGATLIDVKNREDIDSKFIDNLINFKTESQDSDFYESKNMNLLIPMAGLGSRFQTAGYTFPKPLIDVNGKPMIQLVLESLKIKCNTIFIVQEEHYQRYNLKYFLEAICPKCKIVKINGLTEGAACTSLLAKKYINNNLPLIIANSDQYIEWDASKTIESWQRNKKIDGAILTFKSNHPKWSYAKLNKLNKVIKVAEKKPISNNATVGVYYWKKGAEYVKFAEKMIEKDIRTNNEFYICPSYNEAILDKKNIVISEVIKMLGLGTPEDLNYFLSKIK